MSILSYVNAHGAIKPGLMGSEIVKEAQRALLRAGRDLVPDGDFGDITESAIEKFQSDHKLNALGYIGVKTAAALDAVPVVTGVTVETPALSVLKVAPWLSHMRAMNGLREASGSKDNPVIVSWPREIANKYPDIGPDVLWYRHDDVPWCGLAAAICTTRGGEKPPKAPLGAGNWVSFGQKMKLSDRTPGSVFVYSRVGGHHVTMYESEDSSYYYCRGGNQSDQICVTKIPKSREVIAVRWGIHTPVSTAGPKHGATANSVPEGTEA